MIQENVKSILTELPPNVELVAAVKGRTAEEIQEAVEGGYHHRWRELCDRGEESLSAD